MHVFRTMGHQATPITTTAALGRAVSGTESIPVTPGVEFVSIATTPAQLAATGMRALTANEVAALGLHTPTTLAGVPVESGYLAASPRLAATLAQIESGNLREAETFSALRAAAANTEKRIAETVRGIRTCAYLRQHFEEADLLALGRAAPSLLEELHTTAVDDLIAVAEAQQAGYPHFTGTASGNPGWIINRAQDAIRAARANGTAPAALADGWNPWKIKA